MGNTAASHNRQSLEQLLGMLKLEEITATKAGYKKDLQPFRDSITCLSFARETLEPCDQCWLMRFVPREHHDHALPCQQIPLNQNGETVASLELTGDRERMRHEVLAWLRSNIAKLKEELKQSGGGKMPATSDAFDQH